MAEPRKTPLDDLSEWLSSGKASFNRVRQRVGMSVAVLLVLVVAGGAVWWKWEDIAQSLGVESIIARSTPRSQRLTARWSGRRRTPKGRRRKRPRRRRNACFSKLARMD